MYLDFGVLMGHSYSYGAKKVIFSCFLTSFPTLVGLKNGVLKDSSPSTLVGVFFEFFDQICSLVGRISSFLVIFCPL